MQTQVANFPRKNDAVRWEASELRVTTAAESCAAAPIIVCAIIVCVATFRHVYKIVCRARILEDGIRVTQDWKPK